MPTVLVTGCDTGLGREFAVQYARDGWRTIATYRDAANRIPESDGGGGTMEHVQLDVTRFEQMAALKDRLGAAPIDVLLSNAALPLDHKTLGGLDFDFIARQLATNTIGPLKLAETFMDNVAAARGPRGPGKIAIVSSRMGSVGLNISGGHYGYRASKAGLNAVVRSLAIDLFARGILVVALHPGWARTREADAPLSAAESVSGMRAIIRRLGAHETGQFYNYDGAPLAW
jgi:NAD(P)-dependent dehydrogenase (short-subunit alcohol dehydrogenase family)